MIRKNVCIKRNGLFAFQLIYDMISVFQDVEDDGRSEEEEDKDESESEVEVEEVEKEDKTAIACSNEPSSPSPAPSGTKGPQNTAARTSEEVGTD